MPCGDFYVDGLCGRSSTGQNSCTAVCHWKDGERTFKVELAACGISTFSLDWDVCRGAV